MEVEVARKRLLSRRCEPLFYAHWDHALFIHFEIDPQQLQRYVPYPLDLYHGRAFVSLVAFTIRGMRPRYGGSFGALLFKPIATHHFLNLRSYVKEKGEPGIYFMQEWLSSRIATWLGPWSFGLPYRFGRIDYKHEDELRGKVEADTGIFKYCGTVPPNDFDVCSPGSIDEFLLERYTAFTQVRKRRRFFRIWHEPWQHVPAQIQIARDDLISSIGTWWRNVRCLGANYSPGVEVWMGWPHTIDNNDHNQVNAEQTLWRQNHTASN